MEKSTFLIFAVGAALLLLAKSAFANQANGFIIDQGILGFDFGASDMPPIDDNVPLESRVQAMLAVIRQFESGNDYNIIYGGQRFTDMTHHPNIRVPINLPGYEGKFSTAAGAYQINYPTYQQYAPRLGIGDFSAASQDMIARQLLINSGAVQSLDTGDIAGAFRNASSKWASLPGSTANQQPQTLATALSTFNNYLSA